MTRLALLPDPAEQPATVWRQCQFNGAQATLALAAMHLTRHTATFQRSGSEWDRHLATTALRDCEAALAEFRAVLAEGMS